MMGMLPGIGNLGLDPKQMQKAMDQVDDKKLAHIEAIIQSMTPEERANPKLMNPSRKHRLAKGAGLDIAEVNRFIKQFEQSKKMMKQMSGMMKNKHGRMKLPFGGF